MAQQPGGIDGRVRRRQVRRRGVGRSSPSRSTTSRGTSAAKKILPSSRRSWRNWRGGGRRTRVYYLSTAPQFYEPAVAQLGTAGLAGETDDCRRRVVIEKPFGTDLATAQELNEAVHRVFAEQQVYRIDHYLGKETVQNLLVLRFANTIFEPIWNRNYIDHVQITVAEEVDGRQPGRLLRLGRRAARHVPEPPAAAADDHRHGSRRSATRPTRCATRRSRCCRRSGRCTAEEVRRDTFRGQYRGYRDEPDVDARQPHRHVRRAQAVRRQLALAGRAVLPAQRQGACRAARRRS